MIDVVLQHLERLQSDLAAIDPLTDSAAASRVADIAEALRENLRAITVTDGQLSSRLAQLRQMERRAAQAA